MSGTTPPRATQFPAASLFYRHTHPWSRTELPDGK
jgi:hypothetical protein